MKNKKVRPILVESKDIQSSIIMLGVTPNLCRLTADAINDTEWLKTAKPYNLILISLDTNEKIEVEDLVFDPIKNRVINIKQVCKNGNNFGAKKVIATQDQLSPKLIERLVNECSYNQMKDFEIEMEDNGCEVDMEDIGGQDIGWMPKIEPKLTNGFITDVEPDSSNLYTEEEMLEFAWYLHANIGKTTNDELAHFKDKFYLKEWKNN